MPRDGRSNGRAKRDEKQRTGDVGFWRNSVVRIANTRSRGWPGGVGTVFRQHGKKTPPIGAQPPPWYYQDANFSTKYGSFSARHARAPACRGEIRQDRLIFCTAKGPFGGLGILGGFCRAGGTSDRRRPRIPRHSRIPRIPPHSPHSPPPSRTSRTSHPSRIPRIPPIPRISRPPPSSP